MYEKRVGGWLEWEDVQKAKFPFDNSRLPARVRTLLLRGVRTHAGRSTPRYLFSSHEASTDQHADSYILVHNSSKRPPTSLSASMNSGRTKSRRPRAPLEVPKMPPRAPDKTSLAGDVETFVETKIVFFSQQNDTWVPTPRVRIALLRDVCKHTS
eukprot:7271895-Prymnesium_polylepis.1